MEEIVQADILLYYIDFVDGSKFGEIARWSAGKHSNAVQLLRYNSHICYVFNINALFKAYSCPSSDEFISRAPNLKRHLISCTERVEHVILENVYQLQETPFDKPDPFSILYSDDQKLFKNMAKFDFNLARLKVNLCAGRQILG